MGWPSGIVQGKSHKSGEKLKQKSGRQPSTKAESSSSRPTQQPSVTFLFVVNELIPNQQYPRANFDQWGSRLPPGHPDAYIGEESSLVFKYTSVTPDSCSIQRMPEYSWYRTGRDQPGSICTWDQTGEHISITEYHLYKTCTVFRGWRFLPLMFMYNDATITELDNSDVGTMLHAVHLRPRDSNPGVSEVVTRASLYAAGRSADWIPSLLPLKYANPFADAPHSRGLAGELPVILGLMGLSQPPGQGTIDDAFMRGFWRDDKKWRCPLTHNQDAIPGPDQDPRALLVQVCFDPENPTGSNEQTLSSLEWGQIIVAG
ncbi:hypothetical protein NKR23_g7922 [Pleurostoma richardsiae]|uniref:Uncharacterized protein n=1 Tax=Pleurostoma richardsiae TaxID=41990 RepID=A0AA38VD66_9PEZI|nr:hypothetical protein NKR23_g7922 [Pleurostoma richardsiae]